MRAARILVISVAILVSGALAYRYAIILQSMHHLGVPGWSPSAAGPCHLALHPGYFSCGHFPPDPRAPRTEFVQLSIRLWLSALIGYHNWTLPDSAAWLATTDSIRQAFAREGGKALECRTDSSEEHPEGLTYQVWQLPGQTMRLIALKSRYKWVVGSPWEVSVMTQGWSGFSCEPEPRRRLLTPREMMHRLLQQKMEF